MVNLIEFLAQFDSTLLLLIILFVFSFQIIFLTFPLYIVMIFVGYTYGVYIGGIINLIGLVWASLIGFEIGDRSSRFSGAQTNKLFDKYLYWTEKYGIKALIFIRIVPIVPYNVVSVGSGLSKISRREFIWINILTNMHWSFFLAFIGQGYFERVASKVPAEFDPRKWIAGLIIVLIIIFFFLKKINKSIKLNGNTSEIKPIVQESI